MAAMFTDFEPSTSAVSPRSAFAHDHAAAVDALYRPDTRASSTLTGTSSGELSNMMSELLNGGSAAINNFQAGRVQGGLNVAQQAGSLTGWVYVCVNRIRNAVARTPLRLYRSNRAGDESKEILDPVDRFFSLLRNPNPMDTRSEFWSQTVTFYELTGNAIWLKVRDGGKRVRELWVVPSQYVRPGRVKDNVLQSYIFDGNNGSPFEVPASEIVHHRQPNPKNRFWGLGTLAAAAEAMQSQSAIKAAQLKSFSNDILASLYFSTEQNLDKASWERMYATIRAQFCGPAKAGSPVLLFGGVKPVTVVQPPKEMMFRESGSLTRDEIIGIFGVYPLLAGVVENANNANTASQERVFGQYTIHPKLVHIQERINKDLAPEFGTDVEVEFDNPVPDDLVMQANIRNRSVEVGTITINEARAEMGLEPIEGGDVPKFVWSAALNASRDQGPSQPGGSANTQAPSDTNPHPKVDGGVEGAAAKPQVEGPSSGREPGRRLPAPAATTATDAERKRVLGIVSRGVQQDYKKLEKATIPTLRKYFAKQAKRIKERLPELFGHLLAEGADRAGTSNTIKRRVFCVTCGGVAGRLYPDGTAVSEAGRAGGFGQLGAFVEVPACRGGEGVWRVLELRKLDSNYEDGLDDWLKAADQLAERMRPRVEEAMSVGGDAQYGVLGFNNDFDLADGAAVKWLEGKRREYWDETVNATTKDLLSEKLADVLADAPTMEKLEAAVEEVMSGRIRSSAATIARTETISAYNAAAEIVRDELRVPLKSWLATKDSRTRGAHIDADGQQVPQEGYFEVGGERMQHPGDPSASVANIVNCRCTALAVFTDSESLRTAATAWFRKVLFE